MPWVFFVHLGTGSRWLRGGLAAEVRAIGFECGEQHFPRTGGIRVKEKRWNERATELNNSKRGQGVKTLPADFKTQVLC